MKNFIRSTKYFLVQQLKISNKEAIQLITQNRVLINGKVAGINQEIVTEDEVICDEKVLQVPKQYSYFAFYKPRGIETTLNKEIPSNLTEYLNFTDHLFPVGRLDKESEGLLLLTNNGKIFNKIIDGRLDKEKEYQVTVDTILTEENIQALANGIVIMGKLTKPAKVNKVDNHTFKIVLTEGMNRQLRRMCYKLGYTVTKLIRTRIVCINLGNLNPGEHRALTPTEIQELENLV